METTILTIMVIGLLIVFTVDTLQKRHKDFNKGK
jgi:hypothetical protein